MNNGVVIDGGELNEGGQINIYNSLDSVVMQLDSESPEWGSFLRLTNLLGEHTVLIRSQISNTNQHGRIIVYDKNHQIGTVIDGGEGSTSGGQINMYNASELPTFQLDSQGGAFSSGAPGGSFYSMAAGTGATTIVTNAQSTETRGAQMLLKTLNEVNTIELLAQEGATNGGALKLYNYAGDLTIELDADQGTSGKGRVITQEVQITGGSDFAEIFCVSDIKDLQKGMVVCLDSENEGQLKRSTTKYDKSVVGIISGANGIDTGLMMSDTGTIADGDIPVALVGRTYVKTNVEGGEIQIGDLITSSSEKGIAMRAKNKRKTRGAVIGKAMTKADENGFVLVLINLQ